MIVIYAVTAFRGPFSDLIGTLGQRVRKFSIGGLSLELAEVRELKPPQALETELRQLNAVMPTTSGGSGIAKLMVQFQQDKQYDYIVIDLGSDSSPRWLTSRLYLLALLLSSIDRRACLVFVETVGGVRRRFVGTASPGRVQWGLARRYGWLESASAAAHAIVGGLYCDPNKAMQLNPVTNFQRDPTTGYLIESQIIQLIQQFFNYIRVPQPVPDATEWVLLTDGMAEHAKWIDGARIERVLGSDLNTSYVTLLPNKTLKHLTNAVLNQSGLFVAILDSDKTLRGLIDRSVVLENVASEFQKHVESARSD